MFRASPPPTPTPVPPPRRPPYTPRPRSPTRPPTPPHRRLERRTLLTIAVLLYILILTSAHYLIHPRTLPHPAPPTTPIPTAPHRHRLPSPRTLYTSLPSAHTLYTSLPAPRTVFTTATSSWRAFTRTAYTTALRVFNMLFPVQLRLTVLLLVGSAVARATGWAARWVSEDARAVGEWVVWNVVVAPARVLVVWVLALGRVWPFVVGEKGFLRVRRVRRRARSRVRGVRARRSRAQR